MGLLDELRKMFANAEVSLVGGREEREIAERALAAGDFFRARSAAHGLLDRAPRSPIGLALLADACEGAKLDAELEDSLAALARVAGGSPGVWLRLGRVRQRVGAEPREVREAFVRALAWDDDGDELARRAAREARLALADLELAASAPSRAEGWLAPLIDDPSLEVLRRRLASAVQRRARADVERLLTRYAPEVSDADGQRLLGEAQLLLGDRSAAVRSLARAAILADGRALEALREAIARGPGLDDGALRMAETVAESMRLEAAPVWRAAFASARGDAKLAATALGQALAQGTELHGPAERASGRALALAARDVALLELVGVLGNGATPVDAALARAAKVAEASASIGLDEDLDESAALGALDWLLGAAVREADVDAAAWAAALARTLLGRLFPPLATGRPARWEAVTRRLAEHARALAELDAIRRLEHLAAERARPVRIAIVGEFNAGKSTFVNALLGMDVAPTGILPTTAVGHVLRYGPDAIARANLRRGGARTVPPERLKALLKELAQEDEHAVSGVEVEVPFHYLRKVEIVDTPGFNAPDPEHAKTAMATLIEGAGVDLAVWLFDVGQAFKTSERRVLEAIVARGIPVQALLNKADRLQPAELAKVEEVFARDAASIGLRSFRPALAFSARKAVEARLAGDDAALAASGFLPVRALMEDEIPAFGHVLKERGLRRRAYDVVGSLRAAAAREEDAAARASALRRTRDAALADAASALDRAIAVDASLYAPTSVRLGRAEETTRPDLSVSGAKGREDRDALADRCRRVARDAVRDALEGYRRERDELLAADDDAMSGYLDRRLLEHVEAGVGRALAEVNALLGDAAREAYPSDERLAVDAAAIARGLVAAGHHALDGQRPSSGGGLGGPARAKLPVDVEGGLVRAVLAVLAARLRALAAPSDADAAPGLPRAREIAALAEVLAPPPPVDAKQ
jgi:GTP-binding protein EngB required for normal cell division